MQAGQDLFESDGEESGPHLPENGTVALIEGRVGASAMFLVKRKRRKVTPLHAWLAVRRMLSDCKHANWQR